MRLHSLPICFFVLLCAATCRVPISQNSIQILSADKAATVTEVHVSSPALGGYLLWYRAIVPRVAPGERLPILYLLHGANSGPDDFQQHFDVVKLAVTERLIVVMPNAENSYYTNAKLRRNAHWEDAIVNDLTHDVETRFPTLPGREHRGIAGFSMGGYGAVKLALKHPDLYGFVGTMSGAFDITRRPPSLRRWGQTLRIWTTFGLRRSTHQEEDVFTLLNRTTDLKSTKWFQSCGAKDPLYSVNLRFAREMHVHGVALNIVTTPGFHDWQTWGTTMPLLFKAAGEGLR